MKTTRNIKKGNLGMRLYLSHTPCDFPLFHMTGCCVTVNSMLFEVSL